jgi:O-antigen ligase
MYRLQSDFSIGGSSTQSRLVMSEVAWKRFLDKPFFGNGSGQFMNLISDDIRYIAKYGEPLDSHGVWQKVLAENGIFGVLTFGILFFSIMILFYRVLKKNLHEEKILLPIFLGGVGIFVIEFFNTSYYNGKLWLPIAFGLAAINIIKAKNKSRYGKN